MITLPIAAVTLFFVSLHFWARFSLERYKEHLQNQGEKLTIAEQILPPPPEKDNGAQDFLEASASLIDIPYEVEPRVMAMTTPGHARISWMQSQLPSRKLSDAWPALKAYLGSNHLAMEGIRAALSRPVLRFTANYHQGFSVALPHLARLRACSKTFSAAAMSSLHERNTPEGLANLRAVIALASRTEGESTMLSHLVRAAIISIAAFTTWEALHYPEWSDQQLSELQRDWADLDISKSMEVGLALDRAFFILEYSRSRADLGLLNNFTRGTAGSTLDELTNLSQGVLDDPARGWESIMDRFPRRWAWQWWNCYRDELRILKLHQINLACVRQLQPTNGFLPGLRQYQTDIKGLGTPSRQFLIGREMGSEVWEKFIEKLIIAENTKHVVVTAIALARFEKRHGKLAPNLSALVPGFLSTLPLDVIDGHPLRYSPSSDKTFLLYSIGLDGKDGGGDATPSSMGSKNLWWNAGKDWVWPRPASDDEVREYHERLTKGTGRLN